MKKEIEIPEGYEARIEGNKIIIEQEEDKDERIRKMLIEQMERWKKCAEDNNVEQDVEDASDAIAYLEKHKEQKPVDAEWDELQSEFKNINKAFEDGKKDVVAHPERYGLCKSTRWSEEDEKKLKTVISLMRASQAVDPFYDKMCLEGWLKLLPERFNPQSHWKPSEYQMKALKDVIDRALLTCRQQVPLESLYNDLNKQFEI